MRTIFSILATDDNEFTGECCTLMHTSRSQCQQRKCDERVDECITASETIFQSPRIGINRVCGLGKPGEEHSIGGD